MGVEVSGFAVVIYFTAMVAAGC